MNLINPINQIGAFGLNEFFGNGLNQIGSILNVENFENQFNNPGTAEGPGHDLAELGELMGSFLNVPHVQELLQGVSPLMQMVAGPEAGFAQGNDGIPQIATQSGNNNEQGMARATEPCQIPGANRNVAPSPINETGPTEVTAPTEEAGKLSGRVGEHISSLTNDPYLQDLLQKIAAGSEEGKQAILRTNSISTGTFAQGYAGYNDGNGNITFRQGRPDITLVTHELGHNIARFGSRHAREAGADAASFRMLNAADLGQFFQRRASA